LEKNHNNEHYNERFILHRPFASTSYASVIVSRQNITKHTESALNLGTT